MSNELKLACMRALHEVLLRYDADLYYTIDDDGTHLSMGGEELAVFWDRRGLAEVVQAREDMLQKIATVENRPGQSERET